MEFLPLINDSMAKHILGNVKNIRFTKNFVHNVTSISYEELKGSIVTNGEEVTKSNYKNKTFRTDIILRLLNGTKVMIEVQDDNTITTEIKNLFYGLRNLINQLNSGDDYKNVKPVYQIIVVNNDYARDIVKKKMLNDFNITENENKEYVLLKGLYTIKILDIKCEIPYSEFSNELIGWVNLFKSKKRHEAELAVKGIPILESVMKEMNRFMEKEWSRTFAEKFEDDKQAKYEIGREDGKKEGKIAATHEFAKKMIISGESDSKIKEYTKLSLKEIFKLKKQLNIL